MRQPHTTEKILCDIWTVAANLSQRLVDVDELQHDHHPSHYEIHKHQINRVLTYADKMLEWKRFKNKEDDDPLAYALCCSECKSDDIEFQVWADEHDVVQSGGRESGKCYCNKCEDETTCEIKKG